MSRILESGEGYLILYKERGEDSEKIASSGMACLSRLDVPVPGIIAAADSGKRIRVLDKKYFLVCQGRPETDEGIMEDLLFHDSRSNRTFPVKRMRKGVKEARLSYKVLSYNEEKDMSYVEVTLDTGRTHQIRTQFASRKHPLAGDGKYGSRIKCPIALVCGELTYDEGEGTDPFTVKIDPLKELPIGSISLKNSVLPYRP